MLPTSDIDLVIFNVPCSIEDGLQAVADKLKEDGMLASCEVILKTKVPIIKFVSIDGILGDICINQESGLFTAKIVCGFVDQFPCAKPLIIFLKYFLMQRQINETYR